MWYIRTLVCDDFSGIRMKPSYTSITDSLILNF